MNLLSIPQAAARLDLSQSLLRRYCREGRLGIRVGGHWVISEDELLRFQDEPRPVGYPKGRPRDESDD